MAHYRHRRMLRQQNVWPFNHHSGEPPCSLRNPHGHVHGDQPFADWMCANLSDWMRPGRMPPMDPAPGFRPWRRAKGLRALMQSWPKGSNWLSLHGLPINQKDLPSPLWTPSTKPTGRFIPSGQRLFASKPEN